MLGRAALGVGVDGAGERDHAVLDRRRDVFIADARIPRQLRDDVGAQFAISSHGMASSKV